MNARSLYLLILCWINSFLVYSQKPIAHWSFDSEKPLKDQLGGLDLDTARYHCKINLVPDSIGKVMAPPVNCFFLTNVLKRKKSNGDLTVEFLFKGRKFMYTTLPDMDLRISFDDDYLQFVTTSIEKGKKNVDNWIVYLRGAGVTSYNYLANGDWHRFVFVINAKTRTKEVWIDGITDTTFKKYIPPFDILQHRGFDGFRIDGVIDEIVFYDRPKVIEDANSRKRNSSNNIDANGSGSASATRNVSSNTSYRVDSLEFAPGYPNYTVQATDQLKEFPGPRLLSGQYVPRNFPWLDISYLHRELPGIGGTGLGVSRADRAVELTDEMVRRWNYYADIPCLRIDSVTAAVRYTNASGFEKALIDYSNSNKTVPISTVIMQIQNNPSHAGFDRNRPYVIAQDLTDNYYIKDKTGKIVVFENQKWLSPLAPLDVVKKDAQTTSFYLRQLARHLKRPFDMLNDNGELFGHMRPAALLDNDPNVVKLRNKLKLNNAQFNGWFQNRLDSTYKSEVLRSLGWNKTSFTFYNTSAVNPNYWPDYYFRRGTNSRIDGKFRSTPSFYPAFPWNWKLASGPYNGYGVVAEGRRIEMEYGDRFFAPFVCAGWDLEEKNMRPAQWLGLLKSMVMLGADFFHVGYFNVTGKSGWPNGKGPNDPRGYIYQVAMPVYAQAIASRIYDFLEKGELLVGISSSREMNYRMPVSKGNHLIMIRKLGHSYLIFGTVQPNSNFVGNSVLNDSIKVLIEGKYFQFQIRRQGSLYKLDLRDSAAPVVIQLDGWHQYEHPYFWSKDILIEAENADRTSAEVRAITLAPSHSDFRTFRTFARMRSGASMTFEIPTLDSRKYIANLSLRNTSKATSTIIVEFNGRRIGTRVLNQDWMKIPIAVSGETAIFQLEKSRNKSLTISIQSGAIDLDNLIFENID